MKRNNMMTKKRNKRKKILNDMTNSGITSMNKNNKKIQIIKFNYSHSNCCLV